MREVIIYAMLRLIKGFSRLFYYLDIGWVHPPPEDPWRQVRLVTFLMCRRPACSAYRNALRRCACD